MAKTESSHYVPPPTTAEAKEWEQVLQLFERHDPSLKHIIDEYEPELWVRFVRGSAFVADPNKRVRRTYQYIKKNQEFASATCIIPGNISTVAQGKPFTEIDELISSVWPLKLLGTTSKFESASETAVFLFDLENFDRDSAKLFAKDTRKLSRYLACVLEIMHYKLREVWKLSCRSVFIFDLKQVTLQHVKSLPVFKNVFSILGENFPESVEKLVFLNQPFYFGTALKVLSPLLEPDTVLKIEKNSYKTVEVAMRDLEAQAVSGTGQVVTEEVAAVLRKDAMKDRAEQLIDAISIKV